MKTLFYSICTLLCSSTLAFAQLRKEPVPLFKNKDLTPVNVLATEETYLNKSALKITGNGDTTEVQFVKISNLNFTDGTIEIDISGKPGKNSSEGARGFVGIAFRINNDNSKFECIYLRPTNGRAEEQIRRNHADSTFPIRISHGSNCERISLNNMNLMLIYCLDNGQK